ncbi:hypothetical protein ACQ4PT_027868 [Festuca glaucescens]
MAAPIRLAARKIFERPQAFFTTAVKDEQRRLLPKINHGGSLLRRFSSSESANVLGNNSKQLPNSNVEKTASLATRIQEKKHELLHLLGQAEHPKYAMDLENKKLLHLLRKTPGPLPGSAFEFLENNLGKLAIATALGTVAVAYVETHYIFPLYNRVMQHFVSKKTE